jgi:ACR3 family arsenite efflux pump ArsB
MSHKSIVAIGVAVALAASGCRASTVVVGNLTSMCIVIVMMWSTLRMNRDGTDDSGPQ